MDIKQVARHSVLRLRKAEALYLFQVRKSPMPVLCFIEPCLPSPGDKPPSGVNWIHEIKHDGYCLMARSAAPSALFGDCGDQKTLFPATSGTPPTGARPGDIMGA